LFTKKTFHVFWWEYSQKIRSKGFLFSVLFVPLFILTFTLLPTYLAGVSSKNLLNIAIADQTHILKPLMELRLAEKGDSSIHLMSIASENPTDANKQGKELVQQGVVDAYVWLDEHIFTHPAVACYAKGTGNFETMRVLENALSEVVFEEQLRRKDVKLLNTKDFIRAVDLKVVAVNDEDSELIQKYITGIIFVLMMFMSMFNSGSSFMRGVIEEKNSRVIEILISSVKPRELMTGKVLGIGAVGLSQIAAWTLLGLLFGGTKAASLLSGPLMIYFLIYFVLGYFFFASLFSIIGTLFSSDQDIQYVQSVLSAVGIVPVAFAFLVLQDPDSLLVAILSFVPPLTPTLMILRLVISDPPVIHIIGTMSVLLVSLILTMRFSGKIFEIALLMHGKKITVREILRWAKT